MDADPPVAEQLAVLPPVPPQVPIVQQQQQIVPADVHAGPPVADASEPANTGPESGVSEPTPGLNIANLNFMKKVPQFQGKTSSGQSSRS